jgi:hypothetical protein
LEQGEVPKIHILYINGVEARMTVRERMTLRAGRARKIL